MSETTQKIDWEKVKAVLLRNGYDTHIVAYLKQFYEKGLQDGRRKD